MANNQKNKSKNKPPLKKAPAAADAPVEENQGQNDVQQTEEFTAPAAQATTLSPSNPSGDDQSSQEAPEEDDQDDTTEDRPEGLSEAEEVAAASAQAREAASNPAPRVREVAPPRGRVIEPGEEVKFDADKVGKFLVLKEDVYQKFFPPRTNTPSFRLLYRAGTTLPAEQFENKD